MEEQVFVDTTQQAVVVSPAFLQIVNTRSDSPSRKGGVKGQVFPTVIKSDDLEELEEEDEGDELVQEVEPPIDDSDTLNDPIGQTSGQLWSMDWGDLDEERRNFKKRAVLDLPDEVREELACMSGADTDIRPKQKPKLEPPDTVKESNRERKSPTDEEGVPDIAVISSKPARTAEERLAILEARDKLIRIRSNQLPSAQRRNLGKCPDMCPEKERYQRIARHQVDYYEFYRETKEVNHAAMVKIYARSSADQQMPLPHDLRPVNVLWMTMSYLVSQLMDLADSPGENLGEWYHFLWDRMRSIRKDITQLALCDTVSVQILEMCARFHIFCMERLREEKMAVFDEKINRENLTKCLQSLQYMYNDLFLKNVSCPNEPEFQAYSILLHINSDLCASTILGLRPEMRLHEKVKLAINAYIAVSMKNYVRFFKLVKSTTYLNACLLHQYFAQVRAHAMHTIIRAYSRQKMRNLYPVSELQSQLLFDSHNDVLEFCRFSKVPVEENNIVLEKKTSHPIPMQEKMKRSFVGVECKRQSSIRDIVAGGCHLADTAAYHKVHDSFDEQGVLKQEAWYADDQETAAHAVELQYSSSKITSGKEMSTQIRSESSNVSSSLIPSSPFMMAQSSLLQTQNSGITGNQKSNFGNVPPTPPFGLPSVTQDVDHNSEELTNIPAAVEVPDSSDKTQDHPSNNSGLVKPVNSHSIVAIGQSVKDTKSFVFRLPTTKSDSKDGHTGQGVAPGFASRTLLSVFGNSATAGRERIPGSSILRSSSSGLPGNTSQQTSLTTALGFWVSPVHDVPKTAVSSQNSEKDSTISLLPSRQGTSDFNFGSSAVHSEVRSGVNVPDLFPTKSGDIWDNSANSSPSFTSSTKINPVTVSSTTISNQFPVSVYGFPSQPLTKWSQATSDSTLVSSATGTETPFLHTSTSIPSSLLQSQQPSNASHSSSVHAPPRDVTVPTSIFGMHSRPLTAPQMFPTSSALSSITVSPQIAFNSPDSSSSSIAITKTPPTTKTVVGGGFTFSLGKTAPITSSPVVSSSDFLHKTLGSSQSVHHSSTTKNVDSSEKTQVEHESDNDSLKMDVDYEDDIAEITEQLASKPEQFKDVSSTSGIQSFPLPSPPCISTLRKESVPNISKISQKLDANKKQRINQLVREIFHHWRLLTYRSKLRHKLQMKEKCAPLGTTLSLEEQVREYPMPDGCTAIDYQTRLDYILDLEEIRIKHSVFPDIGKIKLENIIRFVLPKALLDKGNLENNMFWKLFLSIPGENEGKKFSAQLCQWIDATFSGDGGEPADIIRVSRTLLGDDYNLYTSVERTVGTVTERLKGVNAFLFFTPQSRAKREYALERYQTLIKSSTAPFPLPLVAVVTSAQWVEECEMWFTSDIQKGKLAAFKIIGPFDESKECILNNLTECITWLSQYVSPSLLFEQYPLREVLLTLMSDLWTRVRFTLAGRCSSGFQQHPEDLLSLYHDALERLQKMVANDKLNQYNDTPPELEDLAEHFLNDSYRSRLILRSPESTKKINNGFSEAQLNICIPSTELLSVESFCEAVCLYNPRLRGPISHFLCSWNTDGEVDWTYVVEAISEIHIRDTIGKLKLKELLVVFLKSNIQKFRQEPWYTPWLKDRLPEQKLIQVEPSDADSPTFLVDEDSPNSESYEPKCIEPDEKFLSDFESLLNELEELNKAELNLSNDSNLSHHSLSETHNKNTSFQFDIFETQLENYAKLFKD